MERKNGIHQDIPNLRETSINCDKPNFRETSINCDITNLRENSINCDTPNLRENSLNHQKQLMLYFYEPYKHLNYKCYICIHSQVKTLPKQPKI